MAEGMEYDFDSITDGIVIRQDCHWLYVGRAIHDEEMNIRTRFEDQGDGTPPSLPCTRTSFPTSRTGRPEQGAQFDLNPKRTARAFDLKRVNLRVCLE